MGELSTTSSSVMQIKFFPKDFGYHKMSFELCEFLPVSFSLLNLCRFSLFPLRVYIFLPQRRTLKRKWINHEQVSFTTYPSALGQCLITGLSLWLGRRKVLSCDSSAIYNIQHRKPLTQCSERYINEHIRSLKWALFVVLRVVSWRYLELM